MALFNRGIGVIVCVLLAFSEIGIHVLRKISVFEGVGIVVVSWQRVDLHFLHFRLDKVLKCSVLLAGLAFVPVLDFDITHTR